MGMSMRPYQMGYGYGMGSTGEPPDYFGSADPGKELAGVMLQARASKRADEEATSLERERKSQADYRDWQRQHAEAMDPINDAIARAKARQMGILGPGETAGGGGGDVQAGLPPAGIMGGSRSQPVAGVQGARNAAGAMGDIGNRPQNAPSGLLGPSGAPPGSASTLPGAFNADTGTHNKADIDLGGGYHMPFSATPEGRQGASADELLHSGLLPNLTPAAAMYLSQHPEHLSALIQAERGRGGASSRYEPQTREEWMENQRFMAGLPKRGDEEKPEMSVPGALQDIDRTMTGRLTPSARMGLAQRMSKKGFNAAKEPAMSSIDDLAAALPDNHDPEKARAVFAKYGFSPATTDSILARAAERKGGAQPKKKGGLFGSGVGPNFP